MVTESNRAQPAASAPISAPERNRPAKLRIAIACAILPAERVEYHLDLGNLKAGEAANLSS
jgi:hypothetical protein